VHQSDGARRNLRLVEELQFLAALGAVALNRASGMRGNTLALFDALGRDREGLAQMQLRWVRLGREALAFLTKGLATEPLELVRQRCNRLVLYGDGLRLRTHDGDKRRSTHRDRFGEVR